MQYGSTEDLRKVRDMLNLTDQIAALKLGQAPLLYTVTIMVGSEGGNSKNTLMKGGRRPIYRSVQSCC